MKYIVILIMTMFLFIGCSKKSVEEMYSKGVEAQRAEQYKDAIDAYQELINTYPDSTRAPEALYAIATIYQNRELSYNKAIQAFRKLVEKYPAHATASSASFLIGFIYNNDLKKYDSARIAYQDFIRLFPTSQLVPSAQFELDNMGKDASEILKERTNLAQEEAKPSKKVKK